MWCALSDERTGLSFTMYSAQYIYMCIQHLQGFCQSRLSTADLALSLLASAYEF
jgi:hypothetical protein